MNRGKTLSATSFAAAKLARRDVLAGLGVALAGCAASARVETDDLGQMGGSAGAGAGTGEGEGERAGAGAGGGAGSNSAGTMSGGVGGEAAGAAGSGNLGAMFKPPMFGASTLIERIAFGSCIRYFPSGPQRLVTNQGWWTYVNERMPQIFMFLGDNVYIDIGERYEDLANVPGFQKCMSMAMPIAVWDDHDFGKDNAGAEYKYKDIIKETFIDFWSAYGGIPASTPRRTRQGNYDATIFGPSGKEMQFLMLDCRYFSASNTTLGDAQWAWLAEELKKPARVRFLMASVPIGEGVWEAPGERDRLFKLITDTSAKGVIVVSGETHSPKITQYGAVAPYSVYDFTSSSVSQGSNPNFAFATVDWNASDPVVNIEYLSSSNGKVFDGRKLALSALGS